MEKNCQAQEINKYIRLYGLSKMLDEALIQDLKLYYFEPEDYIVRAGEYPTHLYFYVQENQRYSSFLKMENHCCANSIILLKSLGM